MKSIKKGSDKGKGKKAEVIILCNKSIENYILKGIKPFWCKTQAI